MYNYAIIIPENCLKVKSYMKKYAKILIFMQSNTDKRENNSFFGKNIYKKTHIDKV